MIPKFRFWHIAEKKMYEVLSIHLMTGMVEVEGGKYFLIPQDGFLMQSTDLLDSQPEPKEIYKDDIVKRTSLMPGGKDFVGVVKMLEGCWVIDNGKEAINLWTEVDENIVIGNIWENPDLVESDG